MLYYGLPTNPSIEILSEITKIYNLGFDYVEIGIEGPEGIPHIINKKQKEIVNLIQKFKHTSIAHMAYPVNLCSDFGYIRDAWILEATREIRTAKEIGIDLINFHANLNGMFYGENRQILLDNLIRSLREIIKYAEKSNVKVMLKNIPLSNGIHKVNEIKYIIDNVPSLFV